MGLISRHPKERLSNVHDLPHAHGHGRIGKDVRFRPSNQWKANKDDLTHLKDNHAEVYEQLSEDVKQFVNSIEGGNDGK